MDKSGTSQFSSPAHRIADEVLRELLGDQASDGSLCNIREFKPANIPMSTLVATSVAMRGHPKLRDHVSLQ